MLIQDVPNIYLTEPTDKPDVFVYDFKMTQDVVKSKVNLSMNMFSFLQVGKKYVHFADSFIEVNKSQSLLIKKGNCLWTELLETENIYFCKLLFFSEHKLREFLVKHSTFIPRQNKEIPYFVIENDDYISAFLSTVTTIHKGASSFMNSMLSIKFEEIMLYLICKYGTKFESYLHSLISEEISPFKGIIESNVYSNLKLEEIAFLCNMSLSTFKRHFTSNYDESPGKWFQQKRLNKAKELLEKGDLKPSEVYYNLGYNNLSNFSTAFKNEFGFSPKTIA